MVGHLLCNKSNPVAAPLWVFALLGVVRAPGGLPSRPLVRPGQGPDFVPRNVPGAVEGLPQDGVVGLLGHGALPALVERRQVVLHEAHDPVLRRGPHGDGQEHVGVGHEVGVHLQQGSLLQNEGGQHHLRKKGGTRRGHQLDGHEGGGVWGPYACEVHAQFQLGEQVEDDAPLVVQDAQILLLVVLRVRHLLGGAVVLQP